MARKRGRWVGAAVVLVLALALAIVPLPEIVAPFRPDWVAIVLIYWSLISQRAFCLATAFIAGLALDTLTGALLGQHALALLVVVYLGQRFHLRVRMFPASQMVVVVAVLLALYQFILFWVDGVAGRTVPVIERWAPVLAGALVWPLLLAMFDHRRRPAEVRL
jgi:rod shape-determining protein MreD